VLAEHQVHAQLLWGPQSLLDLQEEEGNEDGGSVPAQCRCIITLGENEM